MTITDFGNRKPGQGLVTGNPPLFSVCIPVDRRWPVKCLFGTILFLLAVMTLSAGLVMAQPSKQLNDLTGSKLQDQLRKPISVSWSGVSYRDSLMNLARSQQVAVFLDRRVDPDQVVEFSAENIPVGEIFYQIADRTNCGICWLDDVAYVGPKVAVARLVVYRERLLQQTNRFPEGMRKRLRKTGKFDCPRLSEPGELLAASLGELGIELHGQKLPHDLWPGYSLDSVRAIDRLIMLSYGFDRLPDFENSRSMKLVELPEIDNSQLKLLVNKTIRPTVLAKLEHRFPKVQFEMNRNTLTFNSDPETLYEIQRAVKSMEFGDGAGVVSPNGVQVVTLNSTYALKDVLGTAANKLSVTFQADPALRDILVKRVTINVTQVTYEELIQEALKGTGLEYKLDDKTLTIIKP